MLLSFLLVHRYKHVIILSLISILPLFTLFVTSNYITRSNAISNVVRQLEYSSSIQSKRIKFLLKAYVDRLTIMSQSEVALAIVSSGNLERSFSKSHIRSLPFIEHSKVFKDIVFYDSSDTIVFSTLETDLLHSLYVLGKKHTAISVEKVNDVLCLVLFQNIYYQGEYKGGILITCSLLEIHGIIQEVAGISKTSEMLIASRADNGDAILIHQLSNKEVSHGLLRIPKESTQIPITHAMLKKEVFLVDAFDYAGEPVFAATNYIEEVDWGVVVKIDKTEALQWVYSQSYIFFALLIIAVLIVLPACGYFGEKIYLSEKKITDDVNMVKEASQRIKNSNKDLERFAYVASHDLQEPLRISTYHLRSFLEKQVKIDAGAKKHVDLAIESNNRMKDLITGLLEYSRSGKNGDSEAINVKEFLEDMLVLMNFKIEDSEAEIVLDVGKDLSIVFSGTQLAQVLQNLISNAIKFTKAGEKPKIHIKCWQHKRMCTFCVKDNGIGVKSDEKDKIFNMLYRGSMTNRVSGSGIGLAVCHRIVKSNGGTIWVESEEGSGSSFCFTVPVNRENPSTMSGEYEGVL